MFMLGKPVNETWNRELEQISKVPIENLASGSKFLALGSMSCRSFYNYFGLKIVPGSIGIRHQIHLNVLFYFFTLTLCAQEKKRRSIISELIYLLLTSRMFTGTQEEGFF
jgi:hypothetical protein